MNEEMKNVPQADGTATLSQDTPTPEVPTEEATAEKAATAQHTEAPVAEPQTAAEAKPEVKPLQPEQPYTAPSYTSPTYTASAYGAGGATYQRPTPPPAQNTPYMGGSATWQGSAPNPTASAAPKKKGKAGRVFAKIASVTALAILFGVVSAAVFMGFVDVNVEPGDTVGGYGEAVTGDAVISTGDRTVVSATDAMKEAFEKAELAEQNKLTVSQINIIMEPSMVSINAKGETYVQSFFGTSVYPTQSSGSGIIVGDNDTEILIATNNHVVADANEITVQFVDGESIEALVKGTDAKNDLAVVAVAKKDMPDATMAAITIATLGDSDALVIGEGVVAVGNALGFGQSVTDGIVSALDRAVEDSEGNVSHMIQTNAAINPGNSGGALVNMQGQVIGINSAKYADEAVEGMGFAIPINTALPILEELMARITREEVTDAEKAAHLGITPQDVTSTMHDRFGWPVGVYVSEVEEGSAADKAGILNGDIITKFDGETVANTSALRKTLSYYEAGETVKITLERHERGSFETIVVEVTLDKKPAEG